MLKYRITSSPVKFETLFNAISRNSSAFKLSLPVIPLTDWNSRWPTPSAKSSSTCFSKNRIVFSLPFDLRMRKAKASAAKTRTCSFCFEDSNKLKYLNEKNISFCNTAHCLSLLLSLTLNYSILKR